MQLGLKLLILQSEELLNDTAVPELLVHDDVVHEELNHHLLLADVLGIRFGQPWVLL